MDLDMGYITFGLDDRVKQSMIATNHRLGFNRIGSSMAFVQHYGNHVVLRSYSTNVIDVNLEDWSMEVWSNLDCSRTTIQHVSKWLRNNPYTTYLYLKECLKAYRAGKSDWFADHISDYDIFIVEEIETRY